MERDDERAEAFCQAVEAGEAATLRALFTDHPELSEVVNHNWFYFGATAVGFLAGRGDREAIDALLDFGADPNVKSDWDAGPYHVLDCIVDRPPPINVELADHLISRGAVLDIHAAAGLGRRDALADMLDAEPHRVSEPGPDGATPLHLARDPETATLLLDHGAAIDQRCVDHKSTPAQWAAQGRLDVMRLLLERGARPDLFMAAVLNDVGLAESILASEPEAIDVRVRPGRSHEHVGFGDKYVWALDFADTPLEVARRRDHAEVCDFLIPRSSVFVRLLQASRSGDADAVRALLEEYDGLVESLTQEQTFDVLGGTVEAITLLLEAGANPNVVDEENRSTPMHHAAWQNAQDRLEVLLRHGGDLQIRDGSYLSSPLGWASQAGNEALVHWLAEQSQLDIVDATWLGQTDRVREILLEKPEAIHGFGNGEASPLRTAALFGHTDIVRILLENGADPAVCNPHTGMNAAAVARAHGHDEIATLLES